MKINRIRVKAKKADSTAVKIKTENNGLGALKTLVVVVLIAIQALLFISFYLWMYRVFEWYIAISFILSFIACIRCLSSKRNSVSKAVWIMFLLIGFVFSYAFYFLSDERVFFGKAKKRYKKVFDRAETYSEEYVEPKASPQVQNDSKYLYNAGKFLPYTGTKAEYFPSGAQLFDNVLERIECAESFIFIEFFIVSDGVLLNRLYDILSKKAAEGVDVRLIYDDMGSHGTLSGKSKKKLRAAGIKIQPFNRLMPWFSVALNFRDHRKMIIIDGKTCYSGGSNLADEYINEKRMHGYWKDTGIRLDGKAVDGFTLIFLRQWEFLTKKQEDYSLFLNKSEAYSSNSVVIPYADGLDFAQPIGKSVYENIIAGANERLYIMSPYFILEDTLAQLLINKAVSGVDVRVVLPEVPDKALVYRVSKNTAEKLISCGIRVYLMKNSFVHSKLMLSENSVVVGSINMDLRSFYQQFECAVYTNDTAVMQGVLSDFNTTFSDCTEITEVKRKNIFSRALTGILQLFAPFM